MEQGSGKPFAEFTNDTPSSEQAETYETINLFIPYTDTSFEVQMTLWDIIPHIQNDTQCQSASKTYKSFNACQGTSTYASHSSHIRTYGGVSWRTSGYVSQETLKQVLAGKEWDPITESWGGEYLVNIESGSSELTLEPGRYKVYMVGKGGDPVSTSDGTGWKLYTGGAGGTIIAEISIANSTSASLIVNDTSRNCEFILGGSKLLSAGYGKNGNDGRGYSGSTVGTGGINTVIDDSRISVVSNLTGGDATYAFQWVSGSGGFKVVATVEAVDPVNQGHGHSGNWVSWNVSVQPGPALIMLYKYRD